VLALGQRTDDRSRPAEPVARVEPASPSAGLPPARPPQIAAPGPATPPPTIPSAPPQPGLRERPLASAHPAVAEPSPQISTAAAAAPPTIDEEAALLRRARQAWLEHRPEHARALLVEHRRRFGELGSMIQTREDLELQLAREAD
jgi:hypothetical protein